MTHGCGAVSSGGGGGGFSSGGISTVAIAGAYSSSRRRNSRNDDSGLECCCAICWLIGFLLCIKKMSPKTRIVLTWVWITAIALTSGFLVAENYFQDQTLSDSPWDMRQVKRVSTPFCSSMSIAASSNIDVYLLSSSPRIVSDSSRKHVFQASSYIGDGRYEYWGFYLIEGSSVKVRVSSSETLLDFYVIKGKSNLNKWIDNSDCSNCYRNFTEVLVGTYGYSVTFNFSETDQYYFLFANTYYVSAGAFVDVQFFLTRTYYDVTDGLHICTDSTSCKVDLSIGGSSNIIIQVPKESPDDLSVTVECDTRVYMYVLIFGMVPMFAGVCISLGIYKYSKRGATRATQRRGRSDSQVYTLSRDELNSVSNVNYGLRPPSYVQNPPTYEESVNKA